VTPAPPAAPPATPASAPTTGAPEPPPPKTAAERGAWWIYALAGGAVLAGAGLIWLTSTADDVQRYEVSYP